MTVKCFGNSFFLFYIVDVDQIQHFLNSGVINSSNWKYVFSQNLKINASMPFHPPKGYKGYRKHDIASSMICANTALLKAILGGLASDLFLLDNQ